MRKLRYLTSIVLALALVLSLGTAAFAADAGGITGEITGGSEDFRDPVVPDTPIIVAPVEEDEFPLNTEDHFGYIVGYEDGTVRPQGNITRAEVATIFYRLLTDEAREEFWSDKNDFKDVAPNAWYNTAVSTLCNMGALGGYEDGTFHPDSSITRAELTKIATGFFAEADAAYDGSFSDVRANDWFASAVAKGVELGLVGGYEDGTFLPNNSITRAEACTIVNRTLGSAPHVDHLLPADEMNVWSDNADTGAWYYAAIQEATNNHDYDWLDEDEETEEWTEKLPELNWSALEAEWAEVYGD